MAPADDTIDGLRSSMQRLLDRRRARDFRKGNIQRQSLEGLRFSVAMKQLQALQAIQGLQEVAPRRGEKRSLDISTDPLERDQQRQWLEFKADWLQALLRDTIDELERLDEFEESEALEREAGAESNESGDREE